MKDSKAICKMARPDANLLETGVNLFWPRAKRTKIFKDGCTGPRLSILLAPVPLPDSSLGYESTTHARCRACTGQGDEQRYAATPYCQIDSRCSVLTAHAPLKIACHNVALGDRLLEPHCSNLRKPALSQPLDRKRFNVR